MQRAWAAGGAAAAGGREAPASQLEYHLRRRLGRLRQRLLDSLQVRISSDGLFDNLLLFIQSSDISIRPRLHDVEASGTGHRRVRLSVVATATDRKSTRLNSSHLG